MALSSLEPFLLLFILIILSIGIVLILYNIVNIKHNDLLSFSFLIFLPIFFVIGYFTMKQALQTHVMDSYLNDQTKGNIIGRISKIVNNENYQLLILEDCLISIDKPQSIDLFLENNQDKDNMIRFYSEGIKVYNNTPINSKIGNTVSIDGDIIKFQKATNPGQFDEYQYNKILKYDYKVYCDTLKIINDEYSRYKDFLYRVKEGIFNVYNTALPKKNSGVLSAMVLGDKAALDLDIKELYQTHGISHILSISGLHVSLIGMTLYNLLRKLSLKIPIAVIISILFIYSYGQLTNFSVSTTRAVIMLFLLLISKIIGRTYDLLSAVSLSALIILINNPLQIFSTGFLLSYGAVLGIGLVYPALKALFKIENMFLKNIIEGVLISLSVQIMTLPILLYFFFEISTYSILFNLILVPFVSVIIVLAIIGGLLGILYLPLASFFLGGSYYILNIYEWILSLANHLPNHTLMLGRPEKELIITYYFILFLYILLNYWKQSKYSHFILGLLIIIFIPFGTSNLEVTFLDVGQGDGIYVKSSNETTYLIDGGSSSVKQVGKYRLGPFLKSKGVSSIDYVFISHFDQDHVNGIFEIIEDMGYVEDSGNIHIKNLVLGRIFNLDDDVESSNVVGDQANNSKLMEDELYIKCIEMAKEKGINIMYMEPGDYIQDGDLQIKCLHPVKDIHYLDKNASSLVLSLNYIDFEMLLTGDIEGIGEVALNEVLLTEYGKGVFDILKVAHHGSKNSTFNEFLSIVNPRYSVISAGKDNSYGHPHEELLERLDNVGSEVVITYESGAITIKTDGSKMWVNEYVKTYRLGFRK